MKILVVCQYYYPENFVISNICEELVKRGHDVSVLTGLPNYGYDHILPEYENIKYQEINGVKIHRVKLIAKGHNKFKIILNYLSYWHNARRWIKRCKIKYDVVFSMSLSPVTILSPANLYKKIFNVKHVCYCVDLWPESVLVTKAVKQNSLMYKILYFWSKKLYSKVDSLIIGSPSFIDYFNDVLKIKYESYHCVVQPPLLENIDSITPYSFDSKFHILYCGNIGRIQMVENIPLAMAKIKNENVVFDIIGMGPNVEKLKENIKLYKVENKVIYHGPIPAKKAASYFKSADALYVSLKGDGYVGKTIPNKLVMSLAYKKPILACLKGDGRSILNQSGGGVLVDENINDLANKIDYISSLCELKKAEMGSANRLYFEQNLSIEKTIVKIETILSNNIE